MDQTCKFIQELSGWITAADRPPVVFASYYRGPSRNLPVPYLGLTYTVGPRYPWWQIGDHRYPLTGGQLLPFLGHHGSLALPADAPGGAWFCTFDAAGTERFDGWVRGWQHRPHSVRHDARLIAAYRRVAQAFALTGAQRELHLKAALLSLFAVALDELQGDAAGPQPDLLAPVYDRVHSRFRDPDLGLAELAAAVDLSPDHFGRVFRESTGQTPMAYLHAHRLRQAEALLAATDLRIGEIAREVGYRDPLHFSRRFRAHSGLGPRDWRRRHSPPAASGRAR